MRAASVRAPGMKATGVSPTGASATVPAARLDVAIISGARPALLERTLSSFGPRLFDHFTIGRVFCNVDPAFGGPPEQARCEEIVRKVFPEADVHRPDRGEFGAAVKRAWAATGCDLVLHLEDDWLLNEDVTPERVAALQTPDTASVVLMSSDHNAEPGQPFLTRPIHKRFLGLVPYRVRINDFGTSPRFLRGDFARQAADLLIPELDPEKQVRRELNPPLFELCTGHRHACLWAHDRGPIATDIGREWRDARRIRKEVRDGRSHWTGGD